MSTAPITLSPADALLVRGLLEAEWTAAREDVRSLGDAHLALIRADVPADQRSSIVTAKIEAQERAERARLAVANIARQGIV